MQLLIAAETCSESKEKYLSANRKKQVVNPQQKFFKLLIEGLSEQGNLYTTVLSALPISASTYEQIKFKYEEETIKNITYRYVSFKNGKFSRYLTLFLSSIAETRRWLNDNCEDDLIVITDPLVPALSIPTRIISQKRGIKVGAIVTDIPTLCSNMKGRKESWIKTKLINIYQKVSNADLKKYDFYITLTETLNYAVNETKKPYCIIEGFADSKDTEISSVHKNYIMYAGGVYEKYGLKALVNGFNMMKNKNMELWIFGEGPYAKIIEEESNKNFRIKYKGCVSSETIVKYEKEAFLLVNPRPTDEEFAKYSFPSKTIEYLLSGTPVVSTKLPGIPDEYFKYLYSFADYDEITICNTLDEICTLDNNTLTKRGIAGHDFVLEQKNNIVMSKKLVDFIRNV